MDATQVSELRSWASRLEEGSSQELRAAGRAIRMLVDEVESLQAKLIDAQAGAPAEVEAPAPVTALPPEEAPQETAESTEPAWAAADERTHGSFRSRVKKSLGFD
jgi:hypothetical protein